jgi:hypothetical protein
LFFLAEFLNPLTGQGDFFQLFIADVTGDHDSVTNFAQNLQDDFYFILDQSVFLPFEPNKGMFFLLGFLLAPYLGLFLRGEIG